MPPNERRKLVLRCPTFQLINELLYKMGPDQILRRCVLEEEIPKVLKEAHEGLRGRRYWQDYGGQQYTTTPNRRSLHATHVSELGNH